MKAAYHIDPSLISLNQLKIDLLNRELIPSRKPLKHNLEKNFQGLERRGITTLEDLLSALKDRTKISDFSKLTGIEMDYLVLLRREVNSYFPNPVPLKKFPGILEETADRLSNLGFNNSKQFFEYCAGVEDLSALATDAEISLDYLRRLIGLADLVRVYGVGPVFAELLYDAGISSLEVFLSHTPDEIIDLYQERVGKKADFSVSDLQFSQAQAKILLSCC